MRNIKIDKSCSHLYIPYTMAITASHPVFLAITQSILPVVISIVVCLQSCSSSIHEYVPQTLSRRHEAIKKIAIVRHYWSLGTRTTKCVYHFLSFCMQNHFSFNYKIVELLIYIFLNINFMCSLLKGFLHASLAKSFFVAHYSDTKNLHAQNK